MDRIEKRDNRVSPLLRVTHIQKFCAQLLHFLSHGAILMVAWGKPRGLPKRRQVRRHFLFDSPRKLHIYVDESGNFAPYSKQNPVYSVAFVFSERTSELEERTLKHLETLSHYPGGDSFIHMSNIVRGKKPYETFSLEERQWLFYAIFMYAKGIDIKTHSFHVWKSPSPNDCSILLERIGKKLEDMFITHHGFFSSYDRIVVHYDNGQRELGKAIKDAFSVGSPCPVDFVETRQIEEPLMQVADLVCYFETLWFKLDSGNATNSDFGFFGPTKSDIEQKYLEPLRKKELK